MLTGATGLIGSHVLEALAEAGTEARCLVRPTSDTSFVSAYGASVVTGDIIDQESILGAARGCDAIVHTAGLASDWATRKQFRRTNVDGTLAVLKACAALGIRTAVITGSVSSYGEEHCPEPKSEDSPYLPRYPYALERVFPSRMNDYRESKAEATRTACEFARARGIDLVVIEPVWVFGEREFHSGFYEYLHAVKQGNRWMPGSSRNLFHVVYARDLAQAYLGALRVRPPGINRVIVGMDDAVPMKQLHDRFCAEAGLAPPRRLPRAVVWPLAFALEFTSTVLARAKPPLLTRARTAMMYDTIRYSTRKARELLGFGCRYPLEEAVRRTVAWYLERGYL